MLLQPTQTIFEHVLLRPATDGSGLAWLTWRARQQDSRIVQVYVDGQLYDTSASPTRRAMWLQLDPTRGHTVELLAVDESKRWEPMPERLAGWTPAIQQTAMVHVLRDEALSIDQRVVVRVDGELLTDALWSADDHRAGLGGLHGEGRFGFDEATAPGHGLGDSGFGAFGSGGEAWHWNALLPPGEHDIAFEVGPETDTTELTIDDLGEAVTPTVSVGETATLRW